MLDLYSRDNVEKTFLTAVGADHTLAPESFDGFASVGTASHRERVALLPGGPFALWKRQDETGGESGHFAYGWNAAKMVEEQADVAQLVEQLIRNQ